MFILKSGKIKTRSQVNRAIIAKTKADNHFKIIKQCSDEGYSKQYAAEQARMSLHGVNNILYQRLKTTIWPIKDTTK